MERKTVGRRWWAKAVAVGALACGLLVGATPVASAAEPDWEGMRGWIAVESTLSSAWLGGGDSEHVSRAVFVDVDPTSINATWRGDVYYRFQVPDPEFRCQKMEAAGTGVGTAIIQFTRTTASAGWEHGLPVGTGIGVVEPNGTTGQMDGSGLAYLCGRDPYAVPYSEGPPADDAAFPLAGTADWPFTVSRDYTWVDGRGYGFHQVICMTQSQVDSDGDGLPDPVDLSPDKPSSAENLGHPLGSALWDERITNKWGGPDGVKGLPACPGTTSSAGSTPVKSTFSWRMADRFSGLDGNADGLVDYFTPLRGVVFAGGSEVDPGVWKVEVAASNCAPGSRVEWVLDGVSVVSGGCTAVVGFPAYSSRGVPAGAVHTVSLRIDGVEQSSQEVRVKDWLIASIGDSYGSGEGNPDVPKAARAGRGDVGSRWQDKQCHRSASAAGAQVAASVRAADLKASVTLVHLACSGAQIDPGVVTSYGGAAPDEKKAKKDWKAPQIAELASNVKDRKPDALLVSIGGNDIGFSQIIENCLRYRDCHRGDKKCLPQAVWLALSEVALRLGSYPKRCGESARVLFNRKINGLNRRYERLAACLPTQAPVKRKCVSEPVRLDAPARVLVTGYPDVTTGADGNYCGTSGNATILSDALPQVIDQLYPRQLVTGTGSNLLAQPRRVIEGAVRSAQALGYLRIDGAEARWASTYVLRLLNARLKAIAGKYGWTYVDAHVSAARTHGYCAGDQRWVRTWTDAKALQEAKQAGVGPSPGAVHPNVDGQRSYRDAILPKLRALGIPTG